MVTFTGKLLVASPRVDGGFAHTVILITAHVRQGAMGLCINRKAEPEVCPDCGAPESYPTYLGGPLQLGSRYSMIHGIQRLAGKCQEIMPGVYWGSPRKLQKALNLPLDDWRFKLISGYSSWGGGQLESEIAMGVWTVEPATSELVLDGDPDELWDILAPSSLPQFSDN